MSYFPDQLNTEQEKFKNDKEWFKQFITVAEMNSYKRLLEVQKIDRYMNRFAGYVTQDYDSMNKLGNRQHLHIVKNNNYAAAKLYLLLGEMLEKPLNGVVYSVNPSAKIEKFNKLALMTGLYHGREARDKVKSISGIDMFENLPVPNEDPTSQEYKMRDRLQHENVMQLVLNGLIEKGNVKSKLFRDYKHLLLADETFGQVVYNESTKIPQYKSIDIRNSIFVELDDDPFLERTPVIGARKQMTLEEILSAYDLTSSQIQELKSIRGTTAPNNQYNGLNFYEYDNTRGMLFWVTDIEFKAESPLYYKISVDNYGKTHTKPFYSNPMDFEDEWETHANNVKKQKYNVGRRYKTFIYTATRIGETVYTNMERKKYVMGSFESPADATYSYTGLLFNRTAGGSVSLYGLLEGLSELYDVCIGMITREIKKAKGKITTFDRAYMKKGGTMKGVLYDAINHGIVEVNSAAEGNEYGADMTNTQKLGMNEIDLSASTTVQQCINIIDAIDRIGDRVTGINENREGMPKASQTATAGTNAIQASRSITFARTYFFDKFTENVLGRLIEYGKVAIANDPDFFINLIGVEGIAYMNSIKNIPYNSYWTYLHDPGKERYIREIMRSYFPQAINGGEMRPVDAMKFEMSETLAEAKSILEEGWEKIRELEAKKMQAEAQMQETSEQRAERLAKELQEDKQLHEMVIEIIKGEAKGKTDMSKVLAEMITESDKIQAQKQQQQMSAPQ